MIDRQITPQQSGIAESLQGAIWRRSSFSGTQGNCVEVATGLAGLVAVRDSKRLGAAVLTFAADQWRTFIQHV